MTEVIVPSLSEENKYRVKFETAATIRERIEIKREAREMGLETLAREFEAQGYMPKRTDI